MTIIVESIDVDKNMIPFPMINGKTAYLTGLQTISFKGKLTMDGYGKEELSKFNLGEPIEKIRSPLGYLLNCIITEIHGNFKDAFEINGIAEQIDPFIDVEFKDCTQIVSGFDLTKLGLGFDELKKITFNEYKDKLMVEEL